MGSVRLPPRPTPAVEDRVGPARQPTVERALSALFPATMRDIFPARRAGRTAAVEAEIARYIELTPNLEVFAPVAADHLPLVIVGHELTPGEALALFGSP